MSDSNHKYQALGTHLKTNRKLQGVIGAVSIFLLFAGIWALTPRLHTSSSVPAAFHVGKSIDAAGNPAFTFADGTVFAKPKDVTVHGLVFWDQWETAMVGECYLRRNLVKNGGFLDKIVFVTTTTDKGDVAALEKLINTEPEAYMRGVTRHLARDVPSPWNGLNPEILYVKIDSSIVYMSDAAVPALVQHRLSHRSPLLISANVINNPALAPIHVRLGAVRPFMPEPIPSGPKDVKDWRTASLPLLPPPTVAFDNALMPLAQHQWLPVNASNLDDTPASDGDWDDWRAAAQLHYSFFANAETNALGAYNFGAWDMVYEMLSVDMVALWGKDVVANSPVPGGGADGKFWSMDVSQKTKRHVIVDGRALAVRYAFGMQAEGLQRTEVLQRYKAFAKEFCV